MTKWTPEEDKLLLDNLEKTATQIAEIVGRGRNSVIGRAHRLGHKLNDYKPKIETTPYKGTRLRHPEQYTISLRDADNTHCRYSQETGANMRVCGLPVVKRGCCEACYKIMYSLLVLFMLSTPSFAQQSVPVRVQVYNAGIGHAITQERVTDYVRDNNVQVVQEGNTTVYSY